MSICNCSYMKIKMKYSCICTNKITTRTIVNIPKYKNSCNCMYSCFFIQI